MAYLACVIQPSVSFIIETVNTMVILISFNVLDITMNFVALTVVADFDAYMYMAV
jgi:hypothetical protein